MIAEISNLLIIVYQQGTEILLTMLTYLQRFITHVS